MKPKSKEFQDLLQKENQAASMACMTYAMDFTSLMGRVIAQTERENAIKKRAEMQKQKTDSPQIILQQGSQDDQLNPLENLEEKKTSENRSSTNMYVTIVVIVVCVGLLVGAYFLCKSLGNPASSEYPEQLAFDGVRPSR